MSKPSGPRRRRPTSGTTPPPRPAEARLPGDLAAEAELHRMIRVDHAGEFGAARIYDGQLAILGGTKAGAAIALMAAAEREHLRTFEELVLAQGVRPTVLSPLWHLAGFALGAGTALMGPRHAMACTEAVEEVIDQHYRRQVERLGAAEPELRRTLEAFRADERGHRDTAIAEGAREAPGHRPLTRAVKAGTRLAIWLSERI